MEANGEFSGAYPEMGRVSEVRRAWLLRTDKELAHKLQDDEIVNHLSGNKFRNELIREDFPAAAAVQAQDEDMLKREYLRQRYIMEEDARVALDLQKKLILDKKNRNQLQESHVDMPQHDIINFDHQDFLHSDIGLPTMDNQSYHLGNHGDANFQPSRNDILLNNPTSAQHAKGRSDRHDLVTNDVYPDPCTSSYNQIPQLAMRENNNNMRSSAPGRSKSGAYNNEILIGSITSTHDKSIERQSTHNSEDMNNQRLKLPSKPPTNCDLNALAEPSTSSQPGDRSASELLEIRELEKALGVSRRKLYEEQQRLLQEERDAEMARLLNDSEEIIETRDSEMARILQDKEIEKFRRSKEKQRLRHQQKLAETQQKLKVNYNETVLNDTYCQPRDVISNATQPTNHDDPDGDPHYMEVLSTRGSIPSHLNIHTQEKHKNYRALPETPKYYGRPKMAEPGVGMESENYVGNTTTISSTSSAYLSDSDQGNNQSNGKTDSKPKKNRSKKDAKSSKCTIN